MRGASRYHPVSQRPCGARPRWGHRPGTDTLVLALPCRCSRARFRGPNGWAYRCVSAALGKIERQRWRRFSGGRPHGFGQRLRGDFHRDRVRGSHHLPIARTRFVRLLLPINALSSYFQFLVGFPCLSFRKRFGNRRHLSPANPVIPVCFSKNYAARSRNFF